MKKFLLFICLYLCTTFTLHGGIFRAIILADSSSNLSVPIHKDIASLKESLTTICSVTNLELQLEILDGSALNHHNVSTLLTAPNNNGVDVLFFYFTGHGFHLQNNISPWPTLLLSSTREALDSQRICSQLTGYRARLTIIFFDCCNSIRDMGLVVKNLPQESRHPDQAGALRTLFLENSGLIIATASQIGSPAHAFKRGSLFTTTFLTTLLHSSSWNTSWNSLFTQIALQCQPYQTPYVFFNLQQEAISLPYTKNR